jgi:hypothetical protein
VGSAFPYRTQLNQAFSQESLTRFSNDDFSATLDRRIAAVHSSRMKHIPSLLGVVVLFSICYVLTEIALSGVQLTIGIAAAVVVYGATMAWHIRNIL